LGDVIQVIGEFREKIIYKNMTLQIKVENFMKLINPNEEILNYLLTLEATKLRTKENEK